MKKIFIFDVDGTLTPSRRPMTKEFQKFFGEWAKTNKFYLVTGSDLLKLQEQMCFYDIEAERIFTCCGNEMWKPDPHTVNTSANLVYSHKFNIPDDLLKYLEDTLDSSDYPIKAGNHIEDRGSMLNFSIVGRNCTQEQREQYFEWDKECGERKRISKYIREQWRDLDAVIGGQISIDIVPKGFDKSQIMKHIDETYKKRNVDDCEYIFYGDRTEEGGNDYPLAQLLESRSDGRVHKVENWLDTMEQLQNNKFWK